MNFSHDRILTAVAEKVKNGERLSFEDVWRCLQLTTCQRLVSWLIMFAAGSTAAPRSLT